jgi:hypothetical protein
MERCASNGNDAVRVVGEKWIEIHLVAMETMMRSRA